MDKHIENYMAFLRLMAEVKPDGKLDTTGSDIEIYDNSWVGLFRRKWNGDGRTKTFEFLKHKYGIIIELSDHMINSKCSNVGKHDALVRRIEESVPGLMALKDTTYKDSTKFVSNMRSLIDDIITPHIRKANAYLEGRKIALQPMDGKAQPSKLQINESILPPMADVSATATVTAAPILETAEHVGCKKKKAKDQS